MSYRPRLELLPPNNIKLLMRTVIQITHHKELTATISIVRKLVTAQVEDRILQKQLDGFLIQCSSKGIPTFLEPEKIKKGEITVIETVVFPGDRGFLPALVSRLRYIVPGSKIEFVDSETVAERTRNLVRHELASLPADKELRPAIQQIMGAVDKLNLSQVNEVLNILKEKEGSQK